MAETILATMVVGPLVSMVKEKASSYLLEQYNVMEGMEEQHKTLKRKLPAILDVIADAENQAAQHKEGAKAWLEEVRNVAYLGNDVFDEFKYEALRRKAKKEGHYHKLGMHVFKLFPTHNHIVFRYRMGNKLRLILREIEVLVAEMNTFRFEFRPQQQLSMKGRETNPNIQDPMEIASISRAEDKKKLVRTLLDQGGNMVLTVVPIFGMGGLGKTTLAQLVFKDTEIEKHFQLLLWVCVSDNFDVHFLAKRIVEAIPGTVSSNKSPLDSLREVVSGKRYLLVLDDVWNHDVSKWENLKGSLQHGGMGSCVLTTTRDKVIAEFMGKAKAYELGFLDKGFIEEIIKTKASTSEKEIPAKKLVEMVGAMADKCSGSPLAATALGYVLRTKHSVEEWEAVSKRSTICDEETGILPILKLSYNVLPSQMRQCFSFCAMFPKDYEIDVEMLIRLWIANGFILEEKGECPEIRGEQIFKELWSRSFFQDVKETPFDEYRSRYGYCSRMTCKIHDLMHDVAQSAMGKECVTLYTQQSKSEDFPYSTRHLFVPADEYHETVLEGFVEKSSPGLQTLFCTTRYALGELQILSRYNSIRALKIIGGRSSLFLKPKYLHHLRYLDLSHSGIESLPEDVSILYHLQTLDLSDCRSLVQLPKQMKYMTALRHLYTHGSKKLKMMPSELRCLTSLRTLTCFVAGTTGSSCSSLGELELLDLGDQLEVCQLENVTETEARASNLGNKKRLTELTLRWTKTEPQGHQEVLEGLKPHDGIKVLKIFSYGGSTCPTWMNTLQHLVELKMLKCNEINKLPPLWQLPALQVLDMTGMSNLRCLCDGCPPFTFKKLKELRLSRMPNFKAWWDINEMQGQGDPLFPEVEDLVIEDCPELTTLPEAPSLSVLKISRGNRQIYLRAARYITSLSKLVLEATHEREAELLVVDDKEKLDRESSSLKVIELKGCGILLTHSSAPELWNCFVQLEELTIRELDALVHWPENVFQCLASLRKLFIRECKKLTGRTQQEASSEQSTTSVLPPLLESLRLEWCKSLVEVPTLPASLRGLSIYKCDKLESVVVRKQEKLCSEPMPLPNLSLGIYYCNNLRSLSVQLDCTELDIYECGRLRSLCGDLPSSLERLTLRRCESLESIPDVPQAYSSLRLLMIQRCPRLEVLPPCLKQRLNDVKDKYLEYRYTDEVDNSGAEPRPSRPWTWKRAMGKIC